uniref:DUF5641 domain-containing protein n=1 Tax=Toxocara canis TaxID=6265 RepID=A0A183VEJ7_TOXCA
LDTLRENNQVEHRNPRSTARRTPTKDEIVLIKEEGAPGVKWRLGRTITSDTTEQRDVTLRIHSQVLNEKMVNDNPLKQTGKGRFRTMTSTRYSYASSLLSKFYFLYPPPPLDVIRSSAVRTCTSQSGIRDYSTNLSSGNTQDAIATECAHLTSPPAGSLM